MGLNLPDWVTRSGDGYGYGYGSGSGYGYGDGYGYGYGYGDGYGDGYGYGCITIDPDSPWLAWHFIPHNYCTRYTNEHVDVGTVLEVEGEPELCRRGLHASFTVNEARKYCSGILCRVEVSGEVVVGGDKLAATRRKVIAIYPDGQPPKE